MLTSEIRTLLFVSILLSAHLFTLLISALKTWTLCQEDTWLFRRLRPLLWKICSEVLEFWLVEFLYIQSQKRISVSDSFQTRTDSLFAGTQVSIPVNSDSASTTVSNTGDHVKALKFVVSVLFVFIWWLDLFCRPSRQLRSSVRLQFDWAFFVWQIKAIASVRPAGMFEIFEICGCRRLRLWRNW